MYKRTPIYMSNKIALRTKKCTVFLFLNVFLPLTLLMNPANLFIHAPNAVNWFIPLIFTLIFIEAVAAFAPTRLISIDNAGIIVHQSFASALVWAVIGLSITLVQSLAAL